MLRVRVIVPKHIKRRQLHDYTREEIIEYLRKLAKRLGKSTLDKHDIRSDGEVHMSTIIRKCGSFSQVLIAAGLKPQRVYKRNRESMIKGLADLMLKLGREPRQVEMKEQLPCSPYTYKQEFGSLQDAFDLAEEVTKKTGGGESLRIAPNLASLSKTKKRRTCGAEIGFRELRYAPMNEQGVVFLFGMVARDLGFEVEIVQTRYPDCEAKRRLQDGAFEHVLIEFEFKSSHFDHDSAGCDIVVCWEHDWEACPADIEVIELRSVIEELGSSSPTH